MGALAARRTGSAQPNLAIESSLSPCRPTPPAGRPPRLSATATRDTIERQILWLGPMPRRKFAWASLPDEELLQLRLKDLEGHGRGHLARGLPRTAPRRARRAGPPDPAACLDLRRVVQPGRHARHRHPVLSRPSAPDAARAQDDPRRRGRHLVGVHAHPAPRGRPRGAALLSAAAPAPLAAAVRPLLAAAIRATTGPIRPAGITSSICGCGTRRAIRTRISPRPSRSGCGRARTGARAMPAGRRCKKLEYVDELMAEIADAEAGAHAAASGSIR